MHSALVELRQYTLRPGTRDTMIELFDREFVETQEACGIKIIGQFRDLDDPNRFVWLRGFPDMNRRKEALTAFYGGPMWKAHRDAARATMVDTDNALLLRPARPNSAFSLDGGVRLPHTEKRQRGLVVATLHAFTSAPTPDFVTHFQRSEPVLTQAGATVLASFVTDPSPNNFPQLPLRQGEHFFIWFSRFANLFTYQEHRARVERAPEWQELVHRAARSEVLRLSPTSRSLLNADQGT